MEAPQCLQEVSYWGWRWQSYMISYIITSLISQWQSYVIGYISPLKLGSCGFPCHSRAEERRDGRKGSGGKRAGKKGVGKSHGKFLLLAWAILANCLCPNCGILTFSKHGSWVMFARKRQTMLETGVRMFSYPAFSSSNASDHHTFVLKRILLTF